MAWLALLGLIGQPAHTWEPKRLRLRLFNAPAVLARHARQVLLRIKNTYHWATLVIEAHQRLRALRTTPT